MNRKTKKQTGGATLLLGGARSGKSRIAQAMAQAHGGPLTYIATAGAWDGEMEMRIARHRADRDAGWTTIEEQIDLPAAISAATANGAGAVLVDCLTLWLSNLMLDDHDLDLWFDRLELALHEGSSSVPVYLVSNEVGSGIVPETPLGRAFRDEAGRLNQRVAALAPRVALIVAGLPLWLKGGSETV